MESDSIRNVLTWMEWGQITGRVNGEWYTSKGINRWWENVIETPPSLPSEWTDLEHRAPPISRDQSQMQHLPLGRMSEQPPVYHPEIVLENASRMAMRNGKSTYSSRVAPQCFLLSNECNTEGNDHQWEHWTNFPNQNEERSTGQRQSGQSLCTRDQGRERQMREWESLH